MAGIISPEVVAVRRRFIAAKYRADQRDKRSPKPPFSRSSHRVRELERLYRSRYGRHLPDDDAGRDDLELAFNQIARVDACIKWAIRWAPWLPREEAKALADQICAAPQWLKALPMGERLGLTDAERTRLEIRTIRPIDVAENDLAERRRRKDRERKALERERVRTTKPTPISQTRPWQAEGISRATWYRQRAKAGETKSVRNNLVSITADGICLTTPPAIAAGTPTQSTGLVKVDGAAVVGHPIRRFKTRFQTSMRLTKQMKDYGVACAFRPAQIEDIFQMFRDWNIAAGTYSTDWGEVWINWVDRQVTLDTEDHHKWRARTFFDQRAA